jgi:hypothetical protein
MALAEIRDPDLLGCGNCGSKDVARWTYRSGRQKAGCIACGAETPAIPDTEGNPTAVTQRVIALWNRRVPTKGRAKTRAVRLAPVRRGTSSDEPTRDPIELIAKTLVSSSYRVPVEGRGSKPGLQMTDVAAAIGMMRNRLAREVALAVVQRVEEGRIAQLVGMARRRVLLQVLAQRPQPLNMMSPADRHRLRIVIFDAALELVWPERRQPFAARARAAKMRKHSYMVVHKCATSALQEALNEARRELNVNLFGWRR